MTAAQRSPEPDPPEPASAGPAADPDSRARTHLANERTFLAWFRTGLTLIALGIGAAQFLTADTVPGVPVVRGLATILGITGMGMVLGGAQRYFASRSRVDAADFRPANLSVLIAVGLSLVAGVIAIVFVWSIQVR